ncbi:MAG: hypothetical protein LBC41_18595 [Clostridiales bacterium]|jgi:hypothetical protein|nr:hypothetical protein [Clostridiales bacterium]
MQETNGGNRASPDYVILRQRPRRIKIAGRFGQENCPTGKQAFLALTLWTFGELAVDILCIYKEIALSIRDYILLQISLLVNAVLRLW